MPQNETLTIKNVDLELLEAQRLDVVNILLNHHEEMRPHEVDTLEGILNMLDTWADIRDGFKPLPDLIPHWSDV